jgi:hypothetical protein
MAPETWSLRMKTHLHVGRIIADLGDLVCRLSHRSYELDIYGGSQGGRQLPLFVIMSLYRVVVRSKER